MCSAFVVSCAPEAPDAEGDATGGTEGATDTGGTGGTAVTTGGTGGAKTATGGSPGTGGSVVATGGSPGTGGATEQADAAAPPTADASTPPDPVGAEGAPYGCTGCKRLFDGKTLEGWETRGGWVVKEGALASTGAANDIWTKEDIGDARIFFQVRQIKGDHKPCTTLFGTRPAAGAAPKRGLGGAQFQPPNGANWNYGVGGTFTRPTNPGFNVANWHQCEVLIKEAGSFRAACCPVADTPCKGVEVLSWKGTGKKFPFNIMMHNGGLFDEYREIWIERSPTVDSYLSQK